jgi:hypothetical protein
MSVRDQRVSGEGNESEVRQTLSSHLSLLAPLGFRAVVVEISHFLSFE